MVCEMPNELPTFDLMDRQLSTSSIAFGVHWRHGVCLVNAVSSSGRRVNSRSI
jgi:hypothetical protein